MQESRTERELPPHPVFPSASCVHPGNGSKGKSHTGSGRKSRLMKTVQSMKSYGNYQNCTIVRPHIPHSYGTYMTLAPKVLVFPIFVQVSAATGAGCSQCPISAPGSAQLGIHARISLPARSLPCSALLWSWLDLAQCWGLSQRESCPGQAILCWIFSPPLQLSNLALGTCLGQEEVSQLLGFRANFGIADQSGSS